MRSVRTTSLALALIAIAGLAMPVAAADPAGSQPYIVVFRDQVVAGPGENGRPKVDAARVNELVRSITRRAGATPANTFSSVFGGFSARLTVGQLRTVQADPAVASVTPDSAVRLEGEQVGDLLTETQVNLAAPKVPAGIKRVGATRNSVAAIGGDGGRVNADVAVIDTGIQRDHPDLNVVGGYNCTSSNRGKWDDGNGHGTHVAGVIGALDNGQGVVGAAPGVRLWAVKVLDNTGNGLMSWIVCGIDWVTSQRSGDGSRPLIDVVNMSLRANLYQGDDHNCGRTARDPMHSAICRSVAAGTVYVVAAGNDRLDASRFRPAAYDEAITVSAMTDYDGKAGGEGTRPSACPAGYPDDTYAGFSNYGADVDLTAPGVCVLSTWNGGRYAYASGTSMAAPHVAAAAALYKVEYPGAQPQQVKMALQHVAHADWKRSTDPDGRPDLLLWATDYERPPDFDLSASSPSGYAGVDEMLAVPVALSRSHGHSAPITVSVTGLPSAVSVAPVTTGSDKATLKFVVGTSAASGRYTATVAASDGELRRSTDITIRIDASPPNAKFSSPTGTRIQTRKSATIAWTEGDNGGSGIEKRVLWRQRADIVVPGECAGLDYGNVGLPRSAYDTYTDKLYDGHCYRWTLTLRDRAGNQVTTISGTVLVDGTPPAKPTATVVSSSSKVDTAPGLPSAWVDGNGTLWLRGGGSGKLDLHLVAADGQSGVDRISLSPTTSTTGWTFPRSVSGGSLTAHFAYTGSAVPLGLSIRATNRAGLTGSATTFKTVPDKSSPTPPTSVTPGNGLWFSRDGEVTLRWSGSTDTGSGVSPGAYVRRKRAPASGGKCGSFSNNGDPRVLANSHTETGLLSGYCYRWFIRAFDRVGHVSSAVMSGTVLVDKAAPKVTIDKPVPGSTTVKAKTRQNVSWSASDTGGSKMAGVTVQRQRATSHKAGSCEGATWKADGSARTVASPISETGLVNGSCYRWLITARDNATNVTSVYSGAVLISSAASSYIEPSALSVSNLSVVLAADSRMPSTDMAWLDARWSATAGSGTLAGYELRLSSSGGTSWSTFTTPNGSKPFMALRLPAGRTYMVEVRARNTAGVWSAWSAARSFTLKLAQGEGSGFEKVGSWKSASLSGASGGAVGYSTSGGAIIRYSFTGRSVALVSTLAPGRGTADIYVDGYRATTVDLSSATLTTRQVVFTRSWSSSGSHVISLQLRSSARVDVDAVVVLN